MQTLKSQKEKRYGTPATAHTGLTLKKGSISLKSNSLNEDMHKANLTTSLR